MPPDGWNQGNKFLLRAFSTINAREYAFCRSQSHYLLCLSPTFASFALTFCREKRFIFCPPPSDVVFKGISRAILLQFLFVCLLCRFLCLRKMRLANKMARKIKENGIARAIASMTRQRKYANKIEHWTQPTLSYWSVLKSSEINRRICCHDEHALYAEQLVPRMNRINYHRITTTKVIASRRKTKRRKQNHRISRHPILTIEETSMRNTRALVRLLSITVEPGFSLFFSFDISFLSVPSLCHRFFFSSISSYCLFLD